MAKAAFAIEFLSGFVGPLGADLDLTAASHLAMLYGLSHKLSTYTSPTMAPLNHQFINEG